MVMLIRAMHLMLYNDEIGRKGHYGIETALYGSKPTNNNTW